MTVSPTGSSVAGSRSASGCLPVAVGVLLVVLTPILRQHLPAVIAAATAGSSTVQFLLAAGGWVLLLGAVLAVRRWKRLELLLLPSPLLLPSAPPLLMRSAAGERYGGALDEQAPGWLPGSFTGLALFLIVLLVFYVHGRRTGTIPSRRELRDAANRTSRSGR